MGKQRIRIPGPGAFVLKNKSESTFGPEYSTKKSGKKKGKK